MKYLAARKARWQELLALHPELTGARARRWYLILGRIVSLGGWVGLLAAAVFYTRGDFSRPPYDAHAFWLAGSNFLHGLPLYALTGPVDYGGFRYPPVFAMLWAPFSLLPDALFGWLWALLALLALRYLVGSWKRVGWCLWFPPVIIEIVQANTILLTAAAVFWSLRGRGAWITSAVAALKVGPLVTLPYIWIRRPATRRALLIGVALLAGLCLATALLAPAAWPDYFEYLAGQAKSSASLAPFVLLSSPLFDFVFRLILAIALALAAIRWRSDALIFVAAMLAVPIFWQANLAPLVALPRLLTRASRISDEPNPA